LFKITLKEGILSAPPYIHIKPIAGLFVRLKCIRSYTMKVTGDDKLELERYKPDVPYSQIFEV
jgi:hypothetical protein